MKRPRPNMLWLVSVVTLAGLLPACEGGPGEAEFVSACLAEGKQGANQAFSNEMGINRESFCKCAATEARSNLAPDAFRAMILDMQGKGQEARAISAKMNQNEQMAFMGAAVKIFGKCAAGAP